MASPKKRYEKEFVRRKNPIGMTALVSGATYLGEKVMGEVVKGYKKGKSKWSGRKKNPPTAAKMAEAFHGREAKEEFDIDEIESFDSEMAVLGKLLELNATDGKKQIDINFVKDLPFLCCDANGQCLEIIGGDQKLDVNGGVSFKVHRGKKLVPIGFLTTIAYKSDKHHLEGSNGIEEDYQHEFGEEGGTLPMLVYNVSDEKLLIVGGSYTIEDVGIKD